MNKEEIEALVPDSLRPCPRCGGEAGASMYWDVDDGIPMDWTVSLACSCGLRAPRVSFIRTQEKAVEELRKLVAWWNERPIEKTQTEVRDPRNGGAVGLG